MNQTQNGGKWNLLGTFTLDPSLNPKVELSDQANGTVVADAVMVVPSGTSADWFRLGAFSMTPGQNHRVEVAGVLAGETVIDKCS